MNKGQGQDYIDVSFHESPIRGVRYSANLNVYGESLLHGRYVASLRSANGRAKRGWDDQWDSAAWVEALVSKHPAEAFELEIDGQRLDSHWEWVDCRQSEEADGNKQAVVELRHRIRPIRVRIHTRLDGSPFIRRWLEVVNEGSRPAALSQLCPISGLLWRMDDYRGRQANRTDPLFTLGYYDDSQWGFEGNFVWKPLTNGEFAVHGRNGRSGWGCPFFVVRNELNGEFFTAHLEWANNWRMTFIADQEPGARDAALLFRIGPAAPAPMRVIAPGETISSPVVHLGHISGNSETVAQATHDYLRKSVLLADRSRALMFSQGCVVMGDTAWLKRQIDVAADLGMECFVIDAGWYGTEFNNWFDTVGDWNVGAWLDHSLEEIRGYIHAKGMRFGIWMEPETAGARSKLAQEHADWLATRDGLPVAQGRLLDLSKPQVRDWVEAEIFRLIREIKPDFFKLDFNCTRIYEEGRNERDGYGENTQWRHVEALYEIFDKVRAAFPELIVENCSAGGGRNDLGMVRRFHISCQSDYTNQPRNLIGLNHMLRAYPPETFRYYFMMQPDYYQYGDLDFQFRVMLLSNPIVLQFSNDFSDSNPAMKEKIFYYKALYASFVRPLLPACKVYRHTPDLDMHDAAADWCVLEFAGAEGDRAYAAIFRLTGPSDGRYQFRARGLNPGDMYRVTLGNSGQRFEQSGYTLAGEGIAVRIDAALKSELLLFERVG